MPGISDNEQSTTVKFDPPLWMQRRALASRIITDFQFTSLLDIGCGEGALLEIMINSTQFTHLIGIDCVKECIDQALLACEPSPYHKRYMRERPTQVDLLHGSLIDIDDRLFGIDCVCSLEVIEHLFQPVLDAFVIHVFQIYRPQLVVLTTPNAEFNIHFPNLKYNTSESTFRHDDHKFEWTRSEFQSWSNDICQKYGYSVVYTGVGYHPEDNECGPCSQCAIFYKQDYREMSESVKEYESTRDKRLESIKSTGFIELTSELYSPVPHPSHDNQSNTLSMILGVAIKNAKKLYRSSGSTDIEFELNFETLWSIYDVRIAAGSKDILIESLKGSKRVRLVSRIKQANCQTGVKEDIWFKFLGERCDRFIIFDSSLFQ